MGLFKRDTRVEVFVCSNRVGSDGSIIKFPDLESADDAIKHYHQMGWTAHRRKTEEEEAAMAREDPTTRIEIENGKYTFIQRRDGGCEFLRHGEPWMNIGPGVKPIIAMACELEELRAKLSQLSAAVGAAEGTTGQLQDVWSSVFEDTLATDHAKITAMLTTRAKAEALEELGPGLVDIIDRSQAKRLAAEYRNQLKEQK